MKWALSLQDNPLTIGPLLGQRKNSDKHPLPPTKFLVNILIELVITDISGNPSTETGRQTT